MDILKQYFPNAFQALAVKAFVITLIRYIVTAAVCGVVIGILASFPIVGVVFGLIGALIGLYALTGVVLTVLVFTKVLK